MKVRGLLIVSLVLALAMLGFGLWVAAGLEPGARLPVHWNIEGEADRSAPAMVALILPAGMVVLLGILCLQRSLALSRCNSTWKPLRPCCVRCGSDH